MTGGGRAPPSGIFSCLSELSDGDRSVFGTESALVMELSQEEQSIDLTDLPLLRPDRDAAQEGGQVRGLVRRQPPLEEAPVGRPGERDRCRGVRPLRDPGLGGGARLGHGDHRGRQPRGVRQGSPSSPCTATHSLCHVSRLRPVPCSCLSPRLRQITAVVDRVGLFGLPATPSSRSSGGPVVWYRACWVQFVLPFDDPQVPYRPVLPG
jgi:hypothetical protein